MASSPGALPSTLSQSLQAYPLQFTHALSKTFRSLPRPFKILSVIGALYTASLLTHIGDFVWLHFVRPSDLSRYIHPPPRHAQRRSTRRSTSRPTAPHERVSAQSEVAFTVAAVAADEISPPATNEEPATTTKTQTGHDATISDDNYTSAAWALVTGATSGIGLGYATALLNNGFNVIIHGRNPAKLARVRDQLLARFPGRSVETLVIDAEACFFSFISNHAPSTTTTSITTSSTSSKQGIFDDPIRHRFQSYNITVLINNLGGPGTLAAAAAAPSSEHGLCTAHALRPTTHTLSAVAINILFPLEVTRALLPLLQRNAPSLVLNVGSASGRLPMPLLGVHGAVKAFQEAWCRSLAAEMRFLDTRGVKVRYDLVGMCATPGAGGGGGGEKTWLRPDGEGYAAASLALGSAESWWSPRRDVTWGYWPHGLVFGGLIGWVMPEVVREWVVGRIVRGMVADEERLREGREGEVRLVG